ncbi:S8 family serine peptidase [Actinopolymorpha sp. B17G11]|uniref:S8 family serine peptidase n=1 Tax=Actinopolymorpha sp. B17G11 TaxID=3160861 RepID=UPI0032E39AFD
MRTRTIAGRARTSSAALAGCAALAVAASLMAVVPAAAGTPGVRSAGPGVATAGASPTSVHAGVGRTRSITLVTGDRVDVDQVQGGRQAVTVVPGEGRAEVSFSQVEVDDELQVIPLDVVPYLASGQLDRALFNITELLEQGYDDAHRSSVPLILTYRKGVDPGHARTAAPLAAADVGPRLESINGQAVAADKQDAERFWASVDDDRPASAPDAEMAGAPKLAGGIARIRLDRQVHATLDRSVAQIGAPEAWAAGYDGQGVAVAVLDTGVDTTHPDLAGVVTETRNFTTSPSTADAVGHGTHVASTVAGSGAASGGARTGVARGATVMAGKVLGDNGTGQQSWVLDGMEWAANSGARVVNMSLGAGPTDGTDPISEAVDTLTAQTGTLFVVSAGNDGKDGKFTVGTPGAATSALTVGAVDRDESLAEFSSRGPRLGDFAVKPDITAPGVGIVAARAGGTSMGSPVDASYTAASGTSMAAPHVAGAAAILAQRHPDWSADRLKDALVSTAKPADLTVFEQGGGRVDVARAIEQGVYATGTLDLGVMADEAGAGSAEAAEFSRPVTYTNLGAEPVSLDLDLDLRDAAGDPPADDAVRLDASNVEVPPHATATVTVTVDPTRLGRGIFGGHLTGRTADGQVVVHTSLGLVKEAPRHTVTIRGVGRDGEPVTVNPISLFGADSRFDVVSYIPAGSSRTVELAEGSYHLHGMVTEGSAPDTEVSEIIDPAFEVTGDTDVTLDARDANPMTIWTPKPAVQEGILSFHSHREFAGRRITNAVMKFPGIRHLNVTPTAPVAEGTFEFGSRWQLVAPLLDARVVGHVPEVPVEMFYLSTSPALEGVRTLPVVDVGAGAPEDYAGRDVRDRIALIAATGTNYTQLARDAAAAGAAMAVISVRDGAKPWSRWNPTISDRLPTMAVLVSHAAGAQLRGLAEAGTTTDKGKLTLELRGTPASPYLYDIQQVSLGRVPEHIIHRVNDENTATVVTSYREPGGAPWSKEQRFGWRPWQDSALNQYQRLVRTPMVRREIVSSGDTWWQQRVKYHASGESINPLQGGMTQPPRRYEAGQEAHEEWYAPVIRPAIPRDVPGLTSYREGDTLRIRVPEFADAQRGHYGFAEGGFGVPSDVGEARLFRDGALIAEQDWAWGDFPAGGAEGPGTYRLDLSVGRPSPEWVFSPTTETSWTFASRPPAAGERELLGLLQVDYRVDTDLRNRALADRAVSLDLTVRHQDGWTGAPVHGLAAWVSYDDGASWSEVRPVYDTGHGQFRGVVRHPRLGETNGFVTLRVRAEDASGNSVVQTVEHAYALR